jgi:4,5-DOPA dioxygenase extradiol
MNAIEDTEFSRGWSEAARSIPKPKAILCLSAHWETWGTLATAMAHPKTIHDFGGFPNELYEVQYPAPGSSELAREAAAVGAAGESPIGLDREWGLDHGCWSVLRRMYPRADVPVVQLSLDTAKRPADHCALAARLAPLRRQGILIVGSGNMVHNLGRIHVPGGNFADFNTPFGFDWAIEANETFKTLIDSRDLAALSDYPSLGRAVQLAVPTPEHFLPMLYAAALREPDESVAFFNDKPVAGSLTMTSFKIAGAD